MARSNAARRLVVDLNAELHYARLLAIVCAAIAAAFTPPLALLRALHLSGENAVALVVFGLWGIRDARRAMVAGRP